MQILSQVLHVKGLTPLVKDPLISSSFINVMSERVCDGIERKMERVHSKFHYE